MSIPLLQQVRVGAYITRQHLSGNKRYPLALMLEPLFRCNLACNGCGKIDYPDPILNQRLSVQECLEAVDECGAPIVSIAGGEPLLHKEMPEIVRGIMKRKKFVYLCTNALLMERRWTTTSRPYFVWSVHLDGDAQMHDHSVSQEGVYDKAVAAIKEAKRRGFRVNINCTLFNDAIPERVAKFFDTLKPIGVDGITVSPGYAYERAPDQQHFLNRDKTKNLFREILKRGEAASAGRSASRRCSSTSWPATRRTSARRGATRRVRCSAGRSRATVGEGYVKTFKELMEDTNWDNYGVGNYEKCADCMVHCGFEATAVMDTMAHPLKAFAVSRKGIKTDGPFAPDIPIDKQRPAEYVFSRHVEIKLEEIQRAGKGKLQKAAKPAAAA